MAHRDAERGDRTNGPTGENESGMTGARLITGLVAMGLAVPALLFFLLGLHELRQFFILAATCFFSWGVTDLVARILSRPRLRDRSPTDALRNIDLTTKQARQRRDESEPGA